MIMFSKQSKFPKLALALILLAGLVGLWRVLPDNLRNEVEPVVHAATFTINTSDDHDDGVCNVADCSLREAINAAITGDTISFNIAGSGVRTIKATSGFNITKAITIDGTTQPGFAGVPLIELNGAGAAVNGLNVNAPNVNIKGLIINRFSGYGISFDSFGNSSVQGCYIGTNATGTAASANGGGIHINAGGITIGGTTGGAGNLISGNGSGITVTGGSGTSILGNFIGLNAAGTEAISNGYAGVEISGGSAVVGGALPGSRNVISGNMTNVGFAERLRPAQSIGLFSIGVLITGGAGSQVVGNFIGTDPTGAGTIPNDYGVVIDGAANNLIGGTTPAAGNIIKGSLVDGVEIEGAPATKNVVKSNLIAANGLYGVAVSGGASNNQIGGTELRAGNTITGNGTVGSFGTNGGGVRIDGGTGNAVLGNSIFSNTLLGIDLGPFGVTPNDNCESAVGPNINPQNFPVITSASADSTTTTIRGTLNSTPNSQFRIELFANSACDSSGNGEGQHYLGFVDTTTDAACNANFTLSVSNALVSGSSITATATDSNNNTSEFSACVTETGLASVLQFDSTSYSVSEGDHRVDTTVIRTGDNTSTVSVSFTTNDRAGVQNCNVLNGAASSRCDYETRLATLRFAPGETSKTVSVSIIDDSYLEGPETFTLNLNNVVGATLGPAAVATVTITDNELADGPNPVDMASFFVRQQYLDFLNREPDFFGFNFWLTKISICNPVPSCTEVQRINTSADFFLSIEFQNTAYLVERTYKSAYADGTGTSMLGGSHQFYVPVVKLNEFLLDTQQIGEGLIVGQSGWETVLEDNKRAFTLDFVQRPRFVTFHPTGLMPSQFVDALFANAGVTPSTADRNAAIAEFGSATNTSDVAARSRALRDVAENSILSQQESARAFVLMEYFGYLRRNPNDSPDSDYSGYEFWLNKLNAFGGDYQKAELVKAFITSTEYRIRFGP
jgi:CSLREA domain-containing protein